MTSLRGHDRNEFPQSVRKAAFRRACKADGFPKCEAPGCGVAIRAGHLRYEHLDPDGLGGAPTIENCAIYCDVCAVKKDRIDIPRMAKADAVVKSTYGLKPWKKKIQSRGFYRAPPQRRASTPPDKWRGFT